MTGSSVDKRTGCLKLNRHIGKYMLNSLEGNNWFTELNPLFCIINCLVKRSLTYTDA